jgi:hypothetical protein
MDFSQFDWNGSVLGVLGVLGVWGAIALCRFVLSRLERREA